MSSFGTTQKCKACDKTVYAAEVISANGINYHNTCFRCCHCNGRLALSNYSSLDGDLYCKPHFEQLLKEKGSASFKSQSLGRNNELNKNPNKLSSLFSGTQEKCAACKKTVYPLEKVTVDGEFYHQSTCFKCAHGGCKLTTSSYAALDGLLYCKPHFSQLFKEKGSYNHLTTTTNKKNSGPTDEQEGSTAAAADADESQPEPEPEPAPEPEETQD